MNSISILYFLYFFIIYKVMDINSLRVKEFSAADVKRLMGIGVPYFDLPNKNRGDQFFTIVDRIKDYERSFHNTPMKIVPAQKQIDDLTNILNNPFSNYVLCISSYPSDQHAKFLAQIIINEVLKNWKDRFPVGKSYPYWHRIFGGYQNDAPIPSNPSILVLSNIIDNSSNAKIEKLRDLLELYNNIPRIVVVGDYDPCTIFADRLFYPMSAGIYLTPKGYLDVD